jgi:pimeloyl-ACP methyl ester carboxylesterase
MITEPTSTFVTAPDGLRLHVREFGARTAARSAVVCLPGLTRTAEDFDILATALATRGRRVVALDYRGRGRSDYDRDPKNYSLQVELDDLVAVLAAREVAPAVLIGSSRGGLLAMLLAPRLPAAIAGVILNDIGPVIEPKGLMRIKGYVGRIPNPRSYEDGGETLRRLFSQQFPTLPAEAWVAAARRMWREEARGLVPTYDPKLAYTLKGFDPERPVPPMWQQFDALAGMPLMVVRGANSDILSAETVSAMRARRAAMDVLEVADQGHTPLLAETATIARLAAFIDGCGNRGLTH